MRISVEAAHETAPLAASLGRLFADVSVACAKLPEFSGSFSRDAAVLVTLGGAVQCDRWHVRQDVLGFHAVASGTQYDTIDDEIRGVNGWIDVNEKNEAVVNVDAAVELCLEHAQHRHDEEDDVSFMISMIVTPIHEILHVAEFLQRSRGRTPLEVFDEDDGEIGLRAILEDDNTEDRVETVSLRIAEDLHASNASVRSGIEDVLRIVNRQAVAELSI